MGGDGFLQSLSFHPGLGELTAGTQLDRMVTVYGVVPEPLREHPAPNATTLPVRTFHPVILSREKAPVHAGARLVVAGTGSHMTRKAEFSFRPSRGKEQALQHLLGAACEVYNAGLEERREAYKRAGVTVTVYDQFKELTALREVRPDVFRYGVQPLRSSLKRLDVAYSGFLKRASSGRGKAGFPRFRSRNRFDTVSWDEPKSWSVNLEQQTLYVQGVGNLHLGKAAVRQLKRLSARGGVPVTLTITRRRAGKGWSWHAVVGFKNVEVVHQPPVNGPGSVLGLDRGVVVTVAGSDGALHVMPSFMEFRRAELVALQQAMAKKKPGSRAHKQLRVKIKRLRSKVANQTENWARHKAKELVASSDVIGMEDLLLQNMTRSPRGTLECPGVNVAAKAGLNRALQEVALGQLAKWVCVKAEEAGRRTWLVVSAYTSQECHQCGHTEQGNRLTRDQFQCKGCGHTEHADTQAAKVVRKRARAGEIAWEAAGAPATPRPASRFQRRKKKSSP